MPFVPAVNTCLAELRYIWQGEKVENTLYFESSAGMTLALMSDLGDSLLSWWRSEIAILQTANTALKEIFITDLTTATSPTFTTSATTTDVGTNGSADLPNNTTLAISFRSAGRGRSSRGRNYIIGLSESQVDGNLVHGAVASDYGDAYNALMGAGLFVAGLEWVIVSRFSGGAPRSTALVQPVTAAFFVDTVIDSQRRRLPGRGR